MRGFLIYLLALYGLAGWVPPLYAKQFSFGFRALVGFHAIPLFLLLAHGVARLDLQISLWIVIAASGAGIVKLGIEWARQTDRRPALLLHPIFVLPILGLTLATLQGGLSYVPCSSDEFTNWLGASKQIFAVGGFHAAMPYLVHPDFIAGWPLLLVLPMVAAETFDEGLAAAAPFVLHVALLALIFDLITERLSRRGFSRTRILIFGWAFLLLLMAAQATGHIWSGDLLIEPTQEIGYIATFILIFLLVSNAGSFRQVFGAIVFVAAALYTLKVALLTLAPAIAVVLAIYFSHVRIGRAEFSSAIAVKIASAVLCFILPVLVLGYLWQITSPPINPVTSPLGLLDGSSVTRLFSGDGADLARRFSAAVWSYVSSYKTPLTFLGLIFLTLAIRPWQRGSVVCGIAVFVCTYVAALYWYHLDGLGEYYFQNLNSIERFMRIPLRIVHSIGLLFAAFWMIERLERPFFAKVRDWVFGRSSAFLAALACAALFLWCGYKIDRAIADQRTRQDQSLYAIHGIIPGEASRLRAMAGRELPAIPSVVLVDQTTKLDGYQMASYYGIATAFAAKPLDFRVVQKFDWSIGAGAATERGLTREEIDLLSRADVVWPVALDPRLEAALESRIDDKTCAAQPTRYFLRPRGSGADMTFTCIAKTIN